MWLAVVSNTVFIVKKFMEERFNPNTIYSINHFVPYELNVDEDDSHTSPIYKYEEIAPSLKFITPREYDVQMDGP